MSVPTDGEKWQNNLRAVQAVYFLGLTGFADERKGGFSDANGLYPHVKVLTPPLSLYLRHLIAALLMLSSLLCRELWSLSCRFFWFIG